MDSGFSQRLTELRVKHGYSQEQLGRLLYVSRQAVSKWERGDAVPDIDNLTALAKLYNISLDELVGGAEAAQAVEREKQITNRAWINKPHERLYAAVSTVLILLPLVVLFIWLPFLPDTIPAHYNAAGQIDRWGSKFELLLIVAVNPITAAITAGVVWVMRKRVDDDERNKVAFSLFVTLAAVYLVITIIAVVITAKAMSIAGANTNVNIFNIASIVSSSAIMIVGAVMPFVKRNPIFGIRTSITMTSPYMWKKANIIAGIVLFATGLGLNVFNLLYSESYINMVVFAVVNTVVFTTLLLLPRLIKSKNRG